MMKAIALSLCLSAAPAFGAVGQVSFFVSSSCPQGWLNPQETYFYRIYQSSSPELYSVIVDSPVWGSGSDGGTAPWVGFPALAGYFLRAYHKTGYEAHLSQYLSRGSYQNDSFQGHYHSWPANPQTGPNRAAFNSGSQYNTFTIANQGYFDVSYAGYTTDNVNGTPRAAEETRPQNIQLLACVQAVEISSTTSGGSIDMGIFSQFTGGDLSFIFGIILALATIWGFRAGGMGK